MRATYIYGAGDIRVINAPDPVIWQPTDAIVRVVRACICGSDLHPYHNMAATTDGNSIGHECIGVVEETGADVTSVSKGDQVRPLRPDIAGHITGPDACTVTVRLTKPGQQEMRES